MTTSKHFIAIQEGNKSIRVIESKFERETGFVLNIEGKKFKVCELFETRQVAGIFMKTFEGHLFSFFGFETKLGRK
jgi:hypothetical protein